MSETMASRVLRGVGRGWGAAVGPVVRIHRAPALPHEEIALPDRAQARDEVLAAFQVVAGRLRERAATATDQLADNLIATAQMAEDPALHAEVIGGIEAGESAARAVERVVEGFCEMFEAAGGQVAERARDLRQVGERVIAILLGEPEPGIPVLARPSVIVVDDLSPAESAELEWSQVLAVVTQGGGPLSHSTIMAARYAVPCVVRVVGALSLADNELVAVDAARGTVTTNPDAATRQGAVRRSASLRTLEQDRGPGALADGTPVMLAANITGRQDADVALRAGIQAVGLYRTEQLYLGRFIPPSRAELREEFCAVLESFAGQPVTVRTLDTGMMRQGDASAVREGRNPSMGARGFRMTRTDPGILQDQLAALADTERITGTDIWVMAPMIATLDEARAFASMAREAGLRHVGATIEIPAAALRSGDILAEVDFVSLGTNDLAQYTMAADRYDSAVADLLGLWQPAVLDLVALTAAAGAQRGKPVGVCGEMAGDPLVALVLVGMGITSVSMAPASLATVRFSLRHHTLEQCQEMADAAMQAPDAHSARMAVQGMVDSSIRSLLGL